MESTLPNQGYWFVLREDQGNVIFSSNNVAIPAPHVEPEQEPPYYIIEAGKHYPSEVDRPAVSQEDSQSCDNMPEKPHKPKDDKFWDRGRVKLLLTLCLENKNIENKDVLWEEISGVVGATPDQCSIKYKHLRRTFFRLLKKKRMGKDIKWVHYNICEEVFSDLNALPPSILEPWEESKVRRLLSLYIDNLSRFRNPYCVQKEVWKEIADELGSTEYNCYHKFKNLRRSYLNWLNRGNGSSKGMKWVYHQYFERIYYNYNPVKAWDRQKIKQLLDAYAERAHKFRNPKLQKKELWNEIATKVGESADSCDKKFRNLKQTFVRLRGRVRCGKPTTKWRYYKDFEAIYNSVRYIGIDGNHKLIFQYDQEDEDYIKDLLEFYLEHKHQFRDPLIKNKTLWRMIAPKLGMSPAECDKKFRNLKQTYARLAIKMKQEGKCSKWPYFSYFERIYGTCVGGGRGGGGGVIVTGAGGGGGGAARASTPGLGEALRELHECRDSHRRFQHLAALAEESNKIQRERNQILLSLLHRY